MPKNSPCWSESDEPASPPGLSSPGPCPSGAALRSFLEGRPSGPEEREISAHVEQCERCRRALGDLATDPELRDWLDHCGPLRCGPPEEPGLVHLIKRLVAAGPGSRPAEDAPDLPRPSDPHGRQGPTVHSC